MCESCVSTGKRGNGETGKRGNGALRDDEVGVRVPGKDFPSVPSPCFAIREEKPAAASKCTVRSPHVSQSSSVTEIR